MPNVAALLDLRRTAGNVPPTGCPNRGDVNRQCLESCGPTLVGRLALAAELDSHTGCVNSVEYNADGSRLVTGSDDLALKVWDGATARLLHTHLPGHNRNIFCAKFVPHSGDTEVVSCGLDGQVRYACLTDGSNRLIAENDYLCCKLAFSPACPKVFLFCSGDGTVRGHDLRAPDATGPPLVDLNRLAPTTRIRGLRSRIRDTKDFSANSLAFSPVHEYAFAVAASDIYVRVYDLRYVSGLQGAGAPPEGEACFLRLTAQCLLDALPGPPIDCTGISGVAFSATGAEIVATYKGDDVYVFPLRPLRGHVMAHRMVPGAPCDSFAVAGGPLHADDMDFDGHKRGMRTLLPPDTQRYEGRRNVQTLLKEAAFFYGDQYVVSGGDSGHICVWEKRTRRLVKLLKGDQHIVNGVRPHPTRPMLASCGIDNTAKVWGPIGEPSGLDLEMVKAMEADNEHLRQEDEDDFITNAQIRDYFATLLRSVRENREEGASTGRRCHMDLLAAFFGTSRASSSSDEGAEQEAGEAAGSEEDPEAAHEDLRTWQWDDSDGCRSPSSTFGDGVMPMECDEARGQTSSPLTSPGKARVGPPPSGALPPGGPPDPRKKQRTRNEADASIAWAEESAGSEESDEDDDPPMLEDLDDTLSLGDVLNFVAARHRRANKRWAQGNYSAALRHLDRTLPLLQSRANSAQASAVYPSWHALQIQVLQKKAVCCQRLRRPAEVVAVTDALLALAPDDLPALLVRARALAALQRLPEARDAARRVVLGTPPLQIIHSPLTEAEQLHHEACKFLQQLHRDGALDGGDPAHTPELLRSPSPSERFPEPPPASSSHSTASDPAATGNGSEDADRRGPPGGAPDV